jgi:hypothetical protein
MSRVKCGSNEKKVTKSLKFGAIPESNIQTNKLSTTLNSDPLNIVHLTGSPSHKVHDANPVHSESPQLKNFVTPDYNSDPPPDDETKSGWRNQSDTPLPIPHKTISSEMSNCE